LPASSTGKPFVNNCFKLALLIVLALLTKPLPGLGQQTPTSSLESLVTAAQKAQDAHDYAAAVTEYKQAVRIEPKMPELWANLGLMQQQAGDIPAAILSLHQSNLLNPELYVPNLFLGIDLERTGKAPQAIPFLTKAERINKTDPQTPLALGRAYFVTEKFPSAIREFERATLLDPTLDAAWFSLGIARLNQVEADAHQMSTENKSSAFAGALLAESLEKQGRFSEAANLYRSLFDLKPQPPCVHSELGLALLRHHDTEGAVTEFSSERAAHPECGLALLGQARLALDKGDDEQAIKLLAELWGRDHGYLTANAAILLEGMKDVELAGLMAYLSQPSTSLPAEMQSTLLAVFNNGGQPLDENSGEPLPVPPATKGTVPGAAQAADNRTAEEYYAAGEFENCARRLDAVTYAVRADMLRLLAACSYFAGDDERAFTAATALETLQPHSAEALYWSIRANQRLALKSLARFQQLDSNSARSHVLLGDIYYQLERYDEAQSEYSNALAIAPNDPAALLGLATAYLSNNDTQKAMEAAQSALERAPGDPALNLIIAEALVGKGQFAEAEPFLKKSLTAKPQMLGHVHALLGKVYAETGRTRDAIEQLRMSTSSDDNGSIHYLLARLYRQVGDIKDANAAIEEVKAIKERRDRNIKRVEDPDLSSLEASHTDTPGR
jgi:tetratricopeptide (TPR) repeat protein